jgi:MFS family permease
MAWLIWRGLPPDRRASRQGGGAVKRESAWRIISMTLSTGGIWMVAFMFAMYGGSWLAAIGFLPTIYALAGIPSVLAGVVTAVVAGSNALGCVYAGRFLQKGWSPLALVLTGFASMGIGGVVAFALPVPVWVQFLGIFIFSSVSGLVAGTMFTLVIKLAPSPQATPASVGWMQQVSAAGQFSGPPVAAWVATIAGGWQATWMVTASASLLGALTMVYLSWHMRQKT